MDYKQQLPDFFYEEQYWSKGYTVIGIDEVGRGALAGPVYVGVLCLPAITKKTKLEWLKVGINDSKKLTPQRRLKIASVIKEFNCIYAVAASSVEEINNVGIVEAVHIAARRATKKIMAQISPKINLFALLDAFPIENIPHVSLKEQLPIIRGDGRSILIAGASILAKVERDLFISKLAHQFGAYSWEKNKGYGTAEHLKAIKQYGITPHHRKLFVRKVLASSSRILH